MAISHHSDHWFLRKHDDKSVFGPVSFARVLEWARSAQIAPQDSLSEDNESWTKAPMIPDLEMDWLVQMGDELYYGPTTPQAIVEFFAAGEIKPQTRLINCKTNLDIAFKESEFFPPSLAELELESGQPVKGSIRNSLQQRVRELEKSLIEKRQQLGLSEETVKLLENRVRELERQLMAFTKE